MKQLDEHDYGSLHTIKKGKENNNNGKVWIFSKKVLDQTKWFFVLVLSTLSSNFCDHGCQIGLIQLIQWNQSSQN